MLQGHALRIADLLELGDLSSMRAEIDIYERAIQEVRELHFLWQVPLLRANLAHLEGRFEDAERSLRKSLQLRPTGFAYSNLGTLAYMQGRYALAPRDTS